MSWTFYLGLIVFLTVVFTVFSAVAYSVILGVRDNYLRYYQKAELQWTAPGRTRKRPIANLWWLIGMAVVTAWVVVEFVIKPHP